MFVTIAGVAAGMLTYPTRLVEVRTLQQQAHELEVKGDANRAIAAVQLAKNATQLFGR